MKRVINYIKRNKIKSALVVALLFAYYFCLPQHLFKDPTATVIESNNGELLGALIADDGQWRFPATDSIPEKFKTCIVLLRMNTFINILALILFLFLKL